MRNDSSKEPIDLDLKLVKESQGAFLVKGDDDGAEVWLPKSQVQCDRPVQGRVCSFSVPLWLAQDRGLA